MSGALRSTLRSVLLALAFSFAVGLAAGTWLRCRMERPPTYIGQLLLLPAFPLDVADARATIFDAREHEEQVGEAVQVADRTRRE